VGGSIIECLDEGLGEADALVELAEREEPGVVGELAWRWLDHQWRAEEG
jgi:hypothetical protein